MRTSLIGYISFIVYSMQQHIRGLNGIRALSAMAVAAMHFGVFDAGWIGVQFFYVLSGFLITGKLLEARDRYQNIGPYLADFYKRRSLRILPLYLLYLIVVLVAALLSHTLRHDLADLPYLATYTYNFRRGLSEALPSMSLAPHLWSLSVEEQFYVLWPFLIFYCSRRVAIRSVLSAVCAAPLLRLLYIVAAGHTAETSYATYFLTPFQVDGFALGALLSFAPLDQLRKWRLPSAAAVLALITVAAISNRHLPVFGLLWVPRPRVSVWLYTAVDLIGALLVLECTLDSALVRALELRPLRFLGQISYGFYVWHMLLLVVLERYFAFGGYSVGTRLAIFPVYACAVSCVASLSYFFYEKPIMRLRYVEAFRRGRDRVRNASFFPATSSISENMRDSAFRRL